MATEKRLMCVDDFRKNLCHYCNTYMSEEPCEPNECWVHDVIAQTDTVDAVEVVHGQWEPHPRHSGFDRCSVCNDCIVANDWIDGIKWKFCPNCGAKMDGEDDDK